MLHKPSSILLSLYIPYWYNQIPAFIYSQSLYWVIQSNPNQEQNMCMIICTFHSKLKCCPRYQNQLKITFKMTYRDRSNLVHITRLPTHSMDNVKMRLIHAVFIIRPWPFNLTSISVSRCSVKFGSSINCSWFASVDGINTFSTETFYFDKHWNIQHSIEIFNCNILPITETFSLVPKHFTETFSL